MDFNEINAEMLGDDYQVQKLLTKLSFLQLETSLVLSDYESGWYHWYRSGAEPPFPQPPVPRKREKPVLLDTFYVSRALNWPALNRAARVIKWVYTAPWRLGVPDLDPEAFHAQGRFPYAIAPRRGAAYLPSLYDPHNVLGAETHHVFPMPDGIELVGIGTFAGSSYDPDQLYIKPNE